MRKIIALWVLFAPINYSLTYGALRSMQVNDWTSTQGSRPSAYRTAYLLSSGVALTGPTGLGAIFFLQAISGVPGPHFTDWPELTEDDR